MTHNRKGYLENISQTYGYNKTHLVLILEEFSFNGLYYFFILCYQATVPKYTDAFLTPKLNLEAILPLNKRISNVNCAGFAYSTFLVSLLYPSPFSGHKYLLSPDIQYNVYRYRNMATFKN